MRIAASCLCKERKAENFAKSDGGVEATYNVAVCGLPSIELRAHLAVALSVAEPTWSG